MVVVGIEQCCWDQLQRVERYPELDSKTEALDWSEAGGGPTATALVALARWGMSCRFVGVVGDDPIGGRIGEDLRSEGLDVRLIVRPGSCSQRATILVEQGSGKRTIVWQRPSGSSLLPGELPPDLFASAVFLHLDGLMIEASLAAATHARDRGIPIMLDAGRLRPGMGDLAALCDYVVAAEQFAHDLGWDSTPADFVRLARACGYPVFTVTMGDRGSLTWTGEGLFATPAFPVATVDTTGAGDLFHAGYLYGLLQRWPLSQVVRFASAGAALKCRSLGGRQGIPTLAEVNNLLVACDNH